MRARLSASGTALVWLTLTAETIRALAAPALVEPPRRTSFLDGRVRFTVPDKPYVVLRYGPLEAVVVDNRAVDDEVLPGHRAGYHGLGSRKHEKQRRNRFEPSYAGLNFELIHDGTVQDNKILGELLAPFFQPPPELAGKFGAYRSPLIFEDGTPVRSAADWPRRREEIAKQWTGLMGPWPAVIERPNLEVLSETHRDNFAQRRVRLETAPNQTGEGWLLVPDGSGPFPAVLVVYYEPETSVGLSTNTLRDFGYQLARRGLVTLNIGTPGGNARQPETGTAQCQPLSFHAYVAANCWHALANLPEVDRARIGVVGHSYGGKWALFAAALWDKFACVAVSDPGIVFDETRPNVNYWEPWYLGFDPARKRPKAGLPTADNPRTGAYEKMIATGRDLHELHALIAPRPFLVSGGSEDPPERWTALNHALAVNKLLGFTNRVAMTSRPGHTPTEESNAQLYAFFEHFLADRSSLNKKKQTAR